MRTKENRTTSIQALKHLIKAMNCSSFEKLDDDRFVLFITPYINKAYEILKNDIEG
jgi:hypothetical protein